MDYIIRQFRAGDEHALHNLTEAAILVVGRAGYSQEQVTAWAARHQSASHLRERIDGGHVVFVAADTNDAPVAFSLIEPDGHLDQLYCHPDHTRRGLADRVLTAAEDHARAHGMTRLYTEASGLARPAFERAGYTVTQRRDFEIDGVPLEIARKALDLAAQKLPIKAKFVVRKDYTNQ